MSRYAEEQRRSTEGAWVGGISDPEKRPIPLPTVAL